MQHTNQYSRLLHVQTIRRSSKVSFSRYLNAISIATKLGCVQVHGNDFFFGEILFQVESNDPLFCFLYNPPGVATQFSDGTIKAHIRILGVQVFSQLLGDGTSATSRTEGKQSFQYTQVSNEIHTRVIIEPVIF